MWKTYKGSNLTAAISNLTAFETYDFRVRACGTATTDYCSDYSSSVSGVRVLDIQAPDLSLVSSSATSLSFSWDAVDNAVEYRLEQKLQSASVASFVESYKGSDPSAAISNLTAFETYDFRVRACGTATTDFCSDYSSSVSGVRVVDIAEPSLNLTTNNATQLSFSWDAVDNAVEYRLEQKLQSASNASFVESYKGSDPSAAISNLTPFQAYDFRVRACGTATTDYCSDYSSSVSGVRIVDIAEPSLNLTTNNATKLSFSWNAVDNAVEYRLEQKLQSASATSFVETYKGSNLTAAISNLTAFETYDFRVRACGTANTNYCSDYSSSVSGVRVLDIQAPDLSLVSSSATSLSFSWDAVDNAVEYRLEQKLQSASNASFAETYKGSDISTAITNLSAFETYDFRVRACGTATTDYCSDYSSSVSGIRVLGIAEPSLNLTTNNATKLSFSWDAVDNAVEYRLEQKLQSASNASFVETYKGSNLIAAISNLTPFQTYDFRVRACGTATTDYCSDYSSSVSGVRIVDIAEPVLNLTSSNATELSFSWDAVDNAVEYRLEQKLQSASAASFVESYKGSDTSAVVSSLTLFEAYDFRLRACGTSATTYCSNYSAVLVATPVVNLSAPEIASLETGNAEESSIIASWNNVEHATLYRLEAKPADESNYGEVYKGINFSASVTKLIDQDMENFASYNFRVRACATQTDDYCSVYSQAATADFHTSMKLVDNNPLFEYQWHLKNTGAASSFFSREAGEAGVDINVEDVHSQLGLGGKDISVVIVDDGLDSTHPDLRVGTEHSYNFVDGSTDPYTGDEYAHGTAVGGIVAMLNDSTGGVGIAPRVNLYGRNYIGYDDSGAADFDCRVNSHTCVIYSLGILNEVDTQALIYENEVEDEIDVYNNSWGSKPVSHHTFYEYTLLNVYGRYPRYGRDYKGLVYIKSSGNNFVNNANADCSDAQDRGVSCANSSYQSLHSIAEFVVVGAHGADGTTSSETSSGAQVWISAPAGEYGYEADRGLLDFTQDASGNISPHTYYRYFSHRYEPTILTADNSSCSAGYSNDGDETSKNNFDYVWQGKHSLSDEVYTSLFDRIYEEFTLNFLSSRNGGLESNNKIGPHPLNPDCDYTSTFSGTSAAAPMVTGVVALMLDANPDLTWRDIKHILAHTAVNDQDDNRLALTPVELSFPATDVVIDPGWTENAAGYRHSSRFGFGRVDAKAAVDLARNTTANTRGNYTIAWATNSATDTLTSASSVVNTITSSITLSQQTIEDPEYLDVNRPELGTKGIPQFIEHTRINLTFEHAKLEDTIVTLISPSGTRSILHWPIGGNNNINSFDNASLATAAFYGEDATGEWTLEISDLGADVAEDGSLISWNLDVRGR